MIKSKNNGITLIALIITIIVLLILAGVTINAISGNESALDKAQQAKTANDNGEELDAIKLSVVSSIANGLDGKVEITSLKEQLIGIVEEAGRTSITATNSPWIVKGIKTGNYYTIDQNGQVEAVNGIAFTNKNVKIKQGKSTEIEIINITGEDFTLSPTSSNNITITKGENNKAIIDATNAQIGATATFTATAGTETDTCNVEVVFDKAGYINSKIGNNVNYSVTYTENNIETTIDKWQVFYADDENGEVFVISEDILELNKEIDSSDIIYADGASSSSLAVGTYGRKYNSKWFEVEGMPDAAKNTKGFVNTNAKKTAYLCDSTNSNWTKYSNGTFGIESNVKTATQIEGIYAVGGPTIELLYASLNKFDSSKLKGSLTAITQGYNAPFKTGLIEPYKSKYDETNYGSWYIASPSNEKDGSYSKLMSWSENYNSYVSYTNNYNRRSDYGVRPLISIPLDAFDTDWIVQPTTN